MKDFREFKANIVAKIQEKVAQRLQSRKIEIASTLFNEDIDEAKNDSLGVRFNKAFWWDNSPGMDVNPKNTIAKVRKMSDKDLLDLRGTDKDRKLAGRKTPREFQIKVIDQEIKRRGLKVDEDIDEGWNRPEGKLAGWIAMFQGKKIEIRKEKDAKDIWSAKQFAIKALRVPKSKQGLLAIEPAYEEDMKESTDISEGMEAFKAAAEVLKGFGGKMPKSPVDLVKFDDEIEKASKKYKVSVDDIIKVITK